MVRNAPSVAALMMVVKKSINKNDFIPNVGPSFARLQIEVTMPEKTIENTNEGKLFNTLLQNGTPKSLCLMKNGCRKAKPTEKKITLNFAIL